MNDPPTDQQANPPNIPTGTAVREIPLVEARLRRVSSRRPLPVATVEVLSSTPLIGVIDELQPQANSSLSFFDAFERRESINDNLSFFDAVEPPENLQDTRARGSDLRQNAGVRDLTSLMAHQRNIEEPLVVRDEAVRQAIAAKFLDILESGVWLLVFLCGLLCIIGLFCVVLFFCIFYLLVFVFSYIFARFRFRVLRDG